MSTVKTDKQSASDCFHLEQWSIRRARNCSNWVQSFYWNLKLSFIMCNIRAAITHIWNVTAAHNQMGGCLTLKIMECLPLASPAAGSHCWPDWLFTLD